jgi:hypothetical protein
MIPTPKPDNNAVATDSVKLNKAKKAKYERVVLRSPDRRNLLGFFI